MGSIPVSPFENVLLPPGTTNQTSCLLSKPNPVLTTFRSRVIKFSAVIAGLEDTNAPGAFFRNTETARIDSVTDL